ncbi:MAG: phosphate propanoyltransferase [Phycisphaerae bacterium]
MTTLNIPMPREQVERIVRQVVREQFAARLAAGEGQLAAEYSSNLVVNVSARHLHITTEDLARLFGPGAELTVYRWLYQPGEFASEQQVTIVGPRQRKIENVRILGPVRDYTQVEISLTDSIMLGIEAPVRPSGSIEGTPGCTVIGPRGSIRLARGVIRAERHVHMNPADADAYGFADRQYVRLRVESDCAMTFERVLCRVDPRVLLEVHLDTDEGNACNLVNATNVELLP